MYVCRCLFKASASGASQVAMQLKVGVKMSGRSQCRRVRRRRGMPSAGGMDASAVQSTTPDRGGSGGLG
ncbi:unnamed protein product [Clonostachys solani]|uniref:Uncharacterized protein n=1 Tax=Clonostachys solani TaxID=160281 RepID=A0A9N9VZW3_9HYPO|nr:unnamed protein product [Clonostachys solani]